MKRFTYLLIFLSLGHVMADNLTFHDLPKAELHLHLGGSFPKEYLYSLANDQQKEKLEHTLESVAQGVDYHEAFWVFKIISQLVNTEEKIKEGTKALCLDLQQDNVVYVEIRTGLKDLGLGEEEYLKAVLAGIEESSSDDFQAKVLLSLQRASSKEMARKTVDLALKYRCKGVVGIDISGISTKGNIDTIMPELLAAKAARLPFTVHIGESPKETDQMYVLNMLQPDRIGHGVHLTQEARDWIIEHKTPVEMCLTSSVLVQMVDLHKDHPGVDYFKEGHPIAICTDDPLLFSTTMSKELELARHECGFTKKEVEKIVADTFKFVFTEDDICKCKNTGMKLDRKKSSKTPYSLKS